MKQLTLILIPALLLVFSGCSKESSFETGFATPATGTLKDSLGDCDSMSVNGIYTENQQLNNTNTVVITVNVLSAGTYRIATDTANGFSFVDSGFFAAPGIYQVTLKGNGKPILPMTTDFTVTFAGSFCDFSVGVNPGTSTNNPNNADTAWMFDQGTSHYHGHVDSALVKTVGSIVYLNIYGKTATNDSTFYVQLQQSTPTPSGSYSTSAGTAVFEFKTGAGAIIYESRQADGSNLVFTVTGYDATNKILDATFSGTAKDATAAVVPIAGGKMKVQVQ
ncbi:MAG TPA: hypothetical protein VF145_12580 [Chitinophagaceae bacterium]